MPSSDIAACRMKLVVGLLSCYTEKVETLLKYLSNSSDYNKHASKPARSSKTRTWRPISPAEAQRFADAYLAGKSVGQIASESEWSRTAVSAAIKRTGIAIRTTKSSTKEEIQEMVALRASGMSLVKSADRLGYSEKTIWTQLRNAGAN